MNFSEYTKIRKNVLALFDRATGWNTKHVTRRFFPMSAYKEGKMVEYGLYDGQTKKYVLFDIYEKSQDDNINELEKFFEWAITVKT